MTLTSVRQHALGGLIVVLLAVLIAMTISGVDHGPLGSFAAERSAPQQDIGTAYQTSSSKYPGCSFDGNRANDKPGACPTNTKP